MSDSAALPRFSRMPAPPGSKRSLLDNHAANAPRLAGSPRIQLASARDFAALGAEWSDLSSRAAVPNVFMDPAVAQAFAAAWPDKVRVLLAWADEPEVDTQSRLVGGFSSSAEPGSAGPGRRWSAHRVRSPISARR